MDAPIIELPCSFCKGVERCRWPQEYALQPNGERFDGLGRSTRLGVDLDDMRGIAWPVVLSKAGHGTLLQLFDPFDFSLKTVADIDSKPGIFGVEDISFRATLEGVGVGLDKVFESVDPSVELAYFGCVVIFSLFDCLEQGLGDALQGVGVEVGTTVEDVSGRPGRDRVVGQRAPREDRDR